VSVHQRVVAPVRAGGRRSQVRENRHALIDGRGLETEGDRVTAPVHKTTAIRIPDGGERRAAYGYDLAPELSPLPVPLYMAHPHRDKIQR